MSIVMSPLIHFISILFISILYMGGMLAANHAQGLLMHQSCAYHALPALAVSLDKDMWAGSSMRS